MSDPTLTLDDETIDHIVTRIMNTPFLQLPAPVEADGAEALEYHRIAVRRWLWAVLHERTDK